MDDYYGLRDQKLFDFGWKFSQKPLRNLQAWQRAGLYLIFRPVLYCVANPKVVFALGLTLLLV